MKPLSKFFLILSVALCFNAIAQTSLDHYKYFSVKNHFEFLKEPDQYQVNSLTKFLLQKNGFIVLDKTEDYPHDLAKNRCLLAEVDVVKLKGFLKTKLEVQFKNCRNEVVYTSKVGESREKDFKTAYHEALRKAFESISEMGYQFTLMNIISETENTINSLPTSSTDLEQVVVQQSESNFTPKLETQAIPPPINSKETTENITYQPTFQVQSTSFGFNVIYTATGETAFSLHQTMYEGLYIIENQSGIAYKRGDRWVREYVSSNKTIIEPLFQ